MLLKTYIIKMSSKWKYFSENELKCKGTGRCLMDKSFMDQLIELRETFNKPMIITSGYRSKEYNDKIGGAKNSAHLYGRAVDIQVSGKDALELIKLSLKLNFTGIGVSQKGPINSRFIHIDNIGENDISGIVRPTIWSY